MHPTELFQQTDADALSRLVADRGFATLIAVDGGRPVVAQAPVLLKGRRLRFHLFGLNALVPLLTAGAPVVAVVGGPDAYISPDWYGVDDQVPTWNYLSVEMEGRATRLDDLDTTRLLDDLSAHFENRLTPKPPWTRRKMTPGRFEALLRLIVGFEVAVERFEGMRKLGQNKPPAVRAAVAEVLAERPDQGSRDIGRLMAEL